MLMFIGGIDLMFAILGGLVALAILILFGYKVYIADYNRRSMRKKVDSPLKASELARGNLDRAGLSDVKVKVKLLTSGYNHRRKTLYVTRKMDRKATVYSISKVMQFVSLAIIYHTDEDARKKAWGVSFLSWGATAFFFVMIVVSLIVELVGNKTGTPFFLILTIVALLFYIFAMIVSIKKGNLLRRANSDAMAYIQNMEIFDDKDVARINKIYALSAKEYNVNTILSIVYLIYYALKVAGHLIKAFGKK